MLARALVCLLAVMLVGVCLASKVVVAAEKTEATIVGKVEAADNPGKNDPVGRVLVKVEHPAGEFFEPVMITNDKMGQKLAKEANGKTASVTGTVEVKDNSRWITVKEFAIQ